VGAKPPLKPKQVWSIRFHLQRERCVRDLALFDLAVDSKLHGCDLVRLRIADLVVRGEARRRATVVQQKTSTPVQFELTDQTRESLIAWLALRGGALEDYVFPMAAALRLWHALHGRSGRERSITRDQRRQLILRLRALDGHAEGAAFRDLARGLFGADRVPDGPAWKTHDLRSRTLRLTPPPCASEA
jgi:hypothetical protein